MIDSLLTWQENPIKTQVYNKEGVRAYTPKEFIKTLCSQNIRSILKEIKHYENELTKKQREEDLFMICSV